MIKRNTRINKKKEPLYIFLHVMKTGGTTLQYNIRENFEKGECLFLYSAIWPHLRERKDIEKDIKSLTKEQKNELKIIFGHKTYYGLHKFFPGREVRYITFLREPLDRIISRYNFKRTKLAKGNLRRPKKFLLMNGKILPFGRWWFKQNEVFSENYMTKFFFFYPTYRSKGKIIDDSILKKVKKMLDKFYFVGITENPADFLFIYYLLGVKRFFDNANVSKKNYAKGDYKKMENLMLSRNKHDLELYDYAKKLNKKFKKENKAFYPIVYYMKIKRLIFYNLGLYRRYELMRDQLYKQSAKLKKKSKIYTKFVEIIKNER